MSSIKNSKAELIAIYRLEFYKKKKNWKFCANEKKKVVALEPAKILNKTYNVEPDVNEDVSAVDQNFKETSLPKIPTSPRLSPRTNLPRPSKQKPWPPRKKANSTSQPEQACTKTEKAPSESASCQRESVKWANWNKMKNNWTSFNEEQMGLNDCMDVGADWAEESNLAAIQRWPEAEKNMGVCAQHIWSENEQLWREFGQVHPHVNPSEPQYADDGRCRPRGELQLPDCDAWPDEEIREAATTLLAAEACVRTGDFPCLLRQSVAEDSCVEFLRGAHAAPHSSEVDLRFDKDTDPELPFSHLTSKQLTKRITTLAGVLRSLLLELSERTVQGQAPTGLEQPYNLTVEECPTRDIGPSELTNKIHVPLRRDLTYMQDDFLAGSFMQAPERYLQDSSNVLQVPTEEQRQLHVTEYDKDRLMELNGMSRFLDRNTVLDAAGEGRFLQVGQRFMEVSGGVNGRGRGRMKPVIGIGKGRPFRL